MSWLRRVLPDLLVVLLVVGTSSWLIHVERRAAALQATRLLAAERRELVVSHLERMVESLSHVAAGVASASTAPVSIDPEVRGLWVLGLDGAVRTVLVEPPSGTPPPGAADVAAGTDAWRAPGLTRLPAATMLRLAGPVRAKADAPASGVLVALVETARLLRLLETPVDNRRSLAASLCARQGATLHRLDTAAGKAISDADVARALGREEAAALRVGPDDRTYVVAQQPLGFGTWGLVVLASLEESLPASSFPHYVAIPVLVLLGLCAVLLRQPARAAPRATASDSLGFDTAPVTASTAAPAPVAARPGSDVPVLNRGRLELLRKALGTGVMVELINTFTASLPARVAAVRTALDAGDADGVASRGHSLFGSAANLGLERLSAVGHWLDVHGRTVRPKELAAAVELVEGEAEAGLRAISTFVAEQPGELDTSLAGMAELYVRVDGDHVIRAHSSLAGRDATLGGWMVEGKSFLDSAVAGDRARLREALVQAATAPRHDLVEVILAGRADAARMAWSLCRAPGGGVLAFGRDVAPRDPDVAALVAARDDAVAALQARSGFLAAVTHELRTPLNAVIGMSGLLLATELTGEQKDCAQVVRLGAENLLALVNDILDFSKIEAGRMELESIAFELRGAVDDVVDLLALKATQRKVRLVVEADPALPAAVRGDQGRLRQILINLTDNAVKFTAEGGLVTIRLRGLPPMEGQAHAVRFEVQDTGAGIRADVIDRLFQPFSQADAATTRRFGGTGLGLAICKQLVTLMGGGIGVESRVGIGSTFWFALPLPPAGEGEVAAFQEQSSIGPLEPMPFPLRALVVDDNAINQLVATRILERLNVKADVAGSGREALEMLRLLPYDMIFMDYQMPDMDGREATLQIRKLDTLNTRIPIIGLTGDAAPATREACLAVGMDDFLAKPVVPATLSAAVVRWAPATPRVSWRDATTGALGAARDIFADTPNTGRHFDRSRFRQIQELAKQHTDSFFLNVVEVYLTSTHANLEALKRAVSGSKNELAAETAAALRRASEHMGAVVLAEQCRSFEEQLRTGGDLPAAIAQIEREVDAISQVLMPRR